MASNLSKRLDKLERGIQQLLDTNSGPIYLTEDEAIPEGRDAIRIVMNWVEAEPQLEGEEAHSLDDSVSSRKHPLTLPPSETPAEREKRWQKHLQAIDARGERYQGEIA